MELKMKRKEAAMLYNELALFLAEPTNKTFTYKPKNTPEKESWQKKIPSREVNKIYELADQIHAQYQRELAEVHHDPIQIFAQKSVVSLSAELTSHTNQISWLVNKLVKILKKKDDVVQISSEIRKTDFPTRQYQIIFYFSGPMEG